MIVANTVCTHSLGSLLVCYGIGRSKSVDLQIGLLVDFTNVPLQWHVNVGIIWIYA
jgi:hypothetical protein